MGRKKILIFCSASNSIDRKYDDAARELVRALCSLEGVELVSGGTVKGTMNTIVEESVRCARPHTGVLPRFMASVANPHLSETFWTDTMAERKEKMREGTVAAIALPGGIGTLEELTETMTLAKLGRYSSPIYALDVDGFYSPLKALLSHFVEAGMMDGKDAELLSFPATVDELIADLKGKI